MPHLTLNGISLPLAASRSSQREDGTATLGRGPTGALYQDESASKARWEIEVRPREIAYAYAVRRLLRGEGMRWSFDSDLYSSKGLLLASSDVTRSTTTPKFGAGRANVTDTIAYWSDPTPTGWTVGVWVWTGSAWQHRLQTSAGSQWQDGVAGVYGGWDLAPVGGDFELGAGAYDDLVWLPYALPDELAEQWPQDEPWSDLPRFRAGGDLVEVEDTIVEFDWSSIQLDHLQAGWATGYGLGAAVTATMLEV